MQGCGYGMGVVAAVTRTFSLAAVARGEEDWLGVLGGSRSALSALSDWGLGTVSSLFR